MNHHSQPSSFNWSGMPNNTSSSDVAISIEDIGDKVCLSYGYSGSGATSFFAKQALKNSYMYSGANRTSTNAAVLKSDLDLHRSVYLDGGSHAWVCDGYTETKDSDCYNYANYHMNWGWGGS